jgi:mutual gliding-motility protein MglA
MSFIDFSRNIISCKIVYYGPGRCGKTTNLLHIYANMTEGRKGQLISIDTQGDKTLFFDFLPLSLGRIKNFDIKIQLYTVPGQVMYNSSRRLVLKGVDGVVFVADSQYARRTDNTESLENLRENLLEEKKEIKQIPLVLQFNKQDLATQGHSLLSLETLQQDLNSQLQVPYFLGSAVRGDGVFETLREISKLTVKDVVKRVVKHL